MVLSEHFAIVYFRVSVHRSTSWFSRNSSLLYISECSSTVPRHSSLGTVRYCIFPSARAPFHVMVLLEHLAICIFPSARAPFHVMVLSKHFAISKCSCTNLRHGSLETFHYLYISMCSRTNISHDSVEPFCCLSISKPLFMHHSMS